MTIRLTDLTPKQVRLLIRLDDGWQHSDSVGRMASDLPRWCIVEAYDMSLLGLVEFSFGWQGMCWLRITDDGRRLKAAGQAPS